MGNGQQQHLSPIAWLTAVVKTSLLLKMAVRMRWNNNPFAIIDTVSDRFSIEVR